MAPNTLDELERLVQLPPEDFVVLNNLFDTQFWGPTTIVAANITNAVLNWFKKIATPPSYQLNTPDSP